MRASAVGILALCAAAAGCGSAPVTGYLKSDVAEPDDMDSPIAEGVKLQGPLFQEGSLTFEGDGNVQEVFMAYVAKMQQLGWAPFNTEQHPEKGMSAKLVKDIRVAELSVMTGEKDDVKVVIKVGPNLNR
ncbi:MAG TPA: hypothetical protein VI643_05555 [Planctomycetota bacterium]|nr:hypothetical protein [Planctomycetota bacterium]